MKLNMQCAQNYFFIDSWSARLKSAIQSLVSPLLRSAKLGVFLAAVIVNTAGPEGYLSASL
jgi:hypothetical protein